MLSGKPPRPWKKSRRRGVSVLRIVLLVIVLGSAAAYGLWRQRPLPLSSPPIGGERVETPAIDFADESSREPLLSLSRSGLNTYRGEWLGWTCATNTSMPGEVYVLTDDGFRFRPGAEWTPVRITAMLDAGGGEIVREELAWETHELVRRQRRVLDTDAAERFRDLLLDGGYVEMVPGGPQCTDNPVRTLESCVRGRYYGTVTSCGVHGGEPSLSALAHEIDSFALDGASSWPVLRIARPVSPGARPALQDESADTPP